MLVNEYILINISSGQNGDVGVRLQIRDLWTFNKHPRSPTFIYDFSAGGPIPVSNMAIVICGDKLAISLEFTGAKTKHLLLNWRDISQARVSHHQAEIIIFMTHASALSSGSTTRTFIS